MAKKRTKTDFTEQDARQAQFRAYLARKEQEKKERERAASQRKSA